MSKLLLRPEVEQEVKFSRSQIYRLMALGQFPKPIRLSARSVAWLESDIKAWLDARIAESKEGRAV